MKSTKRICRKCSIDKPIDDFYIRSDRKGGRIPYCKKCEKLRVCDQDPEINRRAAKKHYWANRDIVKQKVKLRRQKLISALNRLKQIKGCIDCGKKYPGNLMDFDHVASRGPKKFILSRGYTRSRQELKEELKKVDCVCCLCHRKRTMNEIYQKAIIKPSSRIKQWEVRQEKRKYLDNIKIQKGCEECGLKDKNYPCLFEFDHIKSFSKSFNLTKAPYMKWDKIKEELLKVQSLCVMCHRKKTIKVHNNTVSY